MFGSILSGLGKAIGGHLGGGILSTIGRVAGRALGQYLSGDREAAERYSHALYSGDIALPLASYGDCLPLVFGRSKVQGRLIWLDSVKSRKVQNDVIEYFQGTGDVRSVRHVVSSEMTLSFAMVLCEGEIAEIKKIWAGDDVISLSDFKCRLYRGSEHQMPDPLILSKSHNNIAPAFRGVSYIVFEDFPLSRFKNKIPSLSFEVQRDANINNSRLSGSTQSMIKSIVMIPGSGEYVYDTREQFRNLHDDYGNFVVSKSINKHAHSKTSNSIESLDQLAATCRNVQWISVVVCWFADSLDIATCSIYPAAEFNDDRTTYSEDWQVAGFDRQNARLVSRDSNGYPQYGGTVNDASLLRYLAELRLRGYKIMLCPMIMLDLPAKPWRGHMKGAAGSVHSFFNKNSGYNNFILHYARLTCNMVDAFLIGSEMKSLTAIFAPDNKFPAVDEFVNLAASVKGIMGIKTAISYGADWSEYHHAAGGWYHLDPLWSSPAIDFVGIDAYFPITNSKQGYISDQELQSGMSSGQGYDYYFDEDGRRHALDPAYAWKNLDYWWGNYHTNPDGKRTSWQPKSKKIWFTEYGFPSIDKASNQPNVFFDPYCSDGGIPIHSNGKPDFGVQRRCIRMFIRYWQQKEYIGNMFLWTWDARPCPAWPDMVIWTDRYLWQKGHWVSGKLGEASVSGILSQLSARAGLARAAVDPGQIDQVISGFILKEQMSIMDAINLLRIYAFFDIDSSSPIVKFTSRMQKNISTVDDGDLIMLKGGSYIQAEMIEPGKIAGNVRILYIDYSAGSFGQGCALANHDGFSAKKEYTARLPLLLSKQEAQDLGHKILQNASAETHIVSFKLPLFYFIHQPGDFVTLNIDDVIWNIRIIEVKIHQQEITFLGVRDSVSDYSALPARDAANLLEDTIENEELILLDLPFNITGTPGAAGISAYLSGQGTRALYISEYELKDADIKSGILPTSLMEIKAGACIGKLLRIDDSKMAWPYLIDSFSRFIVVCTGMDKYAGDDSYKLAMAGGEILFFKNCKALGGDICELTNLLRGQFGTEKFISSHSSQEDFVLLDHAPNIVNLSEKFIGQNLYFYINIFDDERRILKKIEFQNLSSCLPAPVVRECSMSQDKLHVRLQGLSYQGWRFWGEFSSSISCYLEIEAQEGRTKTFTSRDGEFDIDAKELAESKGIAIYSLDNNSGQKSQKTYLDIENRTI